MEEQKIKEQKANEQIMIGFQRGLGFWLSNLFIGSIIVVALLIFGMLGVNFFD